MFIGLLVCTNLYDQHDEPLTFGPYRFASEDARAAWRLRLDAEMAEFNIRNVRQDGRAWVSVLYDNDVPLAFAPSTPPIGRLIARLQEQWDSGELTIGQLAFLAA